MSRHEGVSCDSCSKANFRGRRYKCLICYDYDLCATCYEAGATTTRHTTDHPMQCILTRTDFELYYGGETLTAEQPQSFTCPYCSKMGFTEQSLQEHVTSDPSDHTDASVEVVCPICASLPGGDPNHVTDDFAAHLTIEHRAPRDFQDEPLGSIRHHVRRIPHPSRGMGGTRARRSNMHFQSAGSNLPGLSPSARDVTMDPIAELLSQLSSVRNRAAAAQSVSSQLQQLEMQLQSTRPPEHPLILRFTQQLERLPRRQAEAAAVAKATTVPSQPTSILDFSSAPSNVNNANSNSQFLLARLGEPELNEFERQIQETDRADRSQFVQELALSTLAECLRLVEDDEPTSRHDTSSSVSSQSSPADSTDNNVRESSPSSAGHVNDSGGNGGGGGSARSSPPTSQQQQQQANSNNSSLHSASGATVNSNGPSSPQGGGLAGGGGGGGGSNVPPTRPRVAPHVSAATAAAHRNMVKHKEVANASRNSGKEPPPLARH